MKKKLLCTLFSLLCVAAYADKPACSTGISSEDLLQHLFLCDVENAPLCIKRDGSLVCFSCREIYPELCQDRACQVLEF